MRLFVLLFMTFSFYQNGFSQLDSTSTVKDEWRTPTIEGNRYRVKTPELDEVIDYFQNVDTEKLTFTDGKKIGYYTDQFTHYRFPRGDEIKEEKVKKIIDLLIGHEKLHLEHPGRFIMFFYKNFKYFNGEQRKRISSALVRPIGSNFEDHYRVINIYQIKEFANDIRSSLNPNFVKRFKNSFRNYYHFGNENKINFMKFSVLANLDANYQDTLLEVIKYFYDHVNSPFYEVPKGRVSSLKIRLYNTILESSIYNLTNKKEIMSKTLYPVSYTHLTLPTIYSV